MGSVICEGKEWVTEWRGWVLDRKRLVISVGSVLGSVSVRHQCSQKWGRGGKGPRIEIKVDF